MLAPTKRLFSTPQVIADVAIEMLGLTPASTLVDVGCGDGSIVPHLRERTYRGVALSGRMVDLARKHHPDAQFAKAGFFEFLARESTAWDTILFVAALQFFRTLAR